MAVLMAVLRRRLALVLGLLVAGGCGSPTLVVVGLVANGSFEPVTRIDLRLDFPDRTDALTLAESNGAAILLPTDVAAEIRRGEGLLTIAASAHNASGIEVAVGSASVTVHTGETVQIDIPLAPPSPPPPPPPPMKHKLTVSVSGPGQLVSNPPGISCDAQCDAEFDEGTDVELRAQPGRNGVFDSFGGDCPLASDSCTLHMTADRTAAVSFGRYNYVFATSTIQPNGNLGGLVGADAICQKLADQAKLPGTFRAWLSDNVINAIDRLGTARGWVRPDGAPFADTPAQIVAGAVLHAPLLNELGNDLDSGLMATGTYDDGTGGYNCDGWTSGGATSYFVKGDRGAGAGCWTYFGTGQCDQPFNLYCFGVDETTPLRIVPTAGRLAFISQASFDSALGVAGADALCNTEAVTAGHPGSYKALLATTAASAASRFSLSGTPWVSLDGVPLVTKPADLFQQYPKLLAPFTQLSDRSYVKAIDFSVYSGHQDPTAPGAANETCSGWTVDTLTSPGASAVVGQPCVTRASAVNGFLQTVMVGGFNTGCGPSTDPQTPHLYCLQE